jgi:dimethylargininase
MLTALTRAVSRSLGKCELTWRARQEIDIARAAAQHHQYEDSLRELGVRVISLPEEPDLPDAVFVEDPLIVMDEVAIIARMGCESRRPESHSLAEAISPFRPAQWIRDPATIEGGDVMRIDRDVFVGLSTRTNHAGVSQMAEILAPFGYRIRPVHVRGCLHLKSACCPLGDGRILARRAWLDETAFRDYRLIDVDPAEPEAANVLRIGDTVLLSSAFPRTRDLVQSEALNVKTIDISELMKAEAAITCSSVLFEDRPS